MKTIVRSLRPRRSARPRNILCLTVDRLAADMLGAYGATWLETPAFDALAAESVLFDSFHASSLDVDALCRVMWRGEDPAKFLVGADSDANAADASDAQSAPSIFGIMKARGYRTFLLSDVENVALSECVDSEECDGRFLLDGVHVDAPVESLEETAFFRNFEELAKFLVKLEDETSFDETRPWFVWAHFSGWNESWDFPLSLREQYRDPGDEDDPGDPEPYAGVAPAYWRRAPIAPSVAARRRRYDLPDPDAEPVPRLSDDATLDERERARLAAMDEADRRQSVVEAYAGGISAFDETLEGFMALMEEHGILKNALFALAGTRGAALGAPSGLGVPGPDDKTSPFYAEETRVPLAIRLPDGTGATVRLPGLCETRDLFATLRDWPEFAPQLASDDFWKIEKLEISPLAGVWSANGENVAKVIRKGDDANDDSNPVSAEPEDAAATSDLDAYRRLDPTAPGANLLALLADEERAVRDVVRVVARDASSAERAVVLDRWYLKRTPLDPKKPAEDEFLRDDELEAPTERVELFVLPDDRYCVNDVADRCVDVADAVRELLDR